jgi:shikimate kinase
LLRTPNPRQTLADLYAARVPVYQLADITVDSKPDLSVDDMAAQVEMALARRPDVLEGIRA